MDHVSISKGNSKMGCIPSVSLPAVETCIVCDCNKKCYAKKIERLRPSVRNAYQKNLSILKESPDVYWREVEAAIMMSRFFRFHVSGDILDREYLHNMVSIAERNPHCQILCFTKKFDIVTEYVGLKLSLEDPWGREMGTYNEVIPDNLHIIFSAWPGLKMKNPYMFPTAHVRFRDGTSTASEGAVECSGNCAECAVSDGGCWNIKNGESVIFDEH